MFENMPDMEAILAEMRDKFLETAQEKTDRLNEILSILLSSNENSSALIEEFKREVHSLKGMGGTFQMPLVTKLCHALEGFVNDEDVFTADIVGAAQVYVDRICDLIESDEAGDETTLGKWTEGLPKKGEAFTPAKEETNLPKVLLVTDKTDYVESVTSSFSQSGFVVTVSKSVFDGYEKAITERPGVIVVCQSLNDLDGAEFIRSISAMKCLAKSKIAMVCPDRREALREELHGVHLLSESKIDQDILNFIAIAVTA